MLYQKEKQPYLGNGKVFGKFSLAYKNPFETSFSYLPQTHGIQSQTHSIQSATSHNPGAAALSAYESCPSALIKPPFLLQRCHKNSLLVIGSRPYPISSLTYIPKLHQTEKKVQYLCSYSMLDLSCPKKQLNFSLHALTLIKASKEAFTLYQIYLFCTKK